MTRVRIVSLAALGSLVLAAGCAPLVALPGPQKDEAAFQRDDASCRQSGGVPATMYDAAYAAYLQCMAVKGNTVVRAAGAYAHPYYAYGWGYPGYGYDPLLFGPAYGLGFYADFGPGFGPGPFFGPGPGFGPGYGPGPGFGPGPGGFRGGPGGPGFAGGPGGGPRGGPLVGPAGGPGGGRR